MKRISLLFVTLLITIHGLAFAQSTYFQFGGLNANYVTVTPAWTKLATSATPYTFTKKSATSNIEVYVNSRFSVGAITSGNFVEFQVKIDNNAPNFGNLGSLSKSNSAEFLAIYAVFQNLPIGNHTVSLWGKASGTASSVAADPGGLGGAIIVKESN